jgi:prevent-host-death family protein
MPKTVTASEAKNKLGSIVGWVIESGDEVIVESHGQPRAVIMSFQEYEKLRALKEQQRRQDALAQLEHLRQQVGARNRDLTEAQALALADRFVREVVDDMVEEGAITFKRET